MKPITYQTITTIKESEKSSVVLASMDGQEVPVIVKRMQNANPEVYRMLSNIQSKHIPHIYALECREEELVVAEEYVDGESLAEHLQKDMFSDEQKINYALQLCEAVGFLHTLKPSLIHRDIKPSNILINGKGELKLIDFDASRQYKDVLRNSDTRLLGTVEYAPPEQFGYSQTDVRSDIYSIGVVFHEMCLTENKKSAEKWEKIAEKCTSFDPKNRYQSVEELVKEIEKLKNKKKLNLWKLAGLVGVLAVGMAAVLISGIWTKPNREAGGDAVDVTEAPQPTETHTQVVTPELTPEPTPTLMPTPMNELLPVPETINQHYYPGLVEETELILRHGWNSGRQPSEWYGTCYNYADGTTVTLSQDMIDIGDGYIRILDDFLLTLTPSVYELTLYFYSESGGSMGSTDRTLQVHTESAMQDSSSSPFSRSKDSFYVNAPKDFMNDIGSYSTSRFTGVAVQTEGMDRETVETEWYEILCDGKVLILKKEYLLQYAGVDKLTLTYFFDDGRQFDLELTYEGNEDNE